MPTVCTTFFQLLIAMIVYASCAIPTARAEGQGGRDDVAAAERLSEEAFGAYTRKDYARAVTLYKQAHDAAPSPDMLYNIARIYDTGLRDRPLAITFYRRYIADPGADAKRIQTANERLSDLRAAEEAASLNATASDARFAGPATSSPRGPRDRALSSSSEEDESAARWRLAGKVLVGVGVTGLVVGAAFGLSAMADADTAKRSCDGNLCATQAGVNAAENGATKAMVANIGMIGGGALLATGIVAWAVGGRRASEDTRPISIAWEPALSTSFAGTTVSGSF